MLIKVCGPQKRKMNHFPCIRLKTLWECSPLILMRSTESQAQVSGDITDADLQKSSTAEWEIDDRSHCPAVSMATGIH